MRINPLLLLDVYKLGHKFQYPEGTTLVYSNFTPRSGKIIEKTLDGDFCGKAVFLGLQYFVKEYLVSQWNEWFFSRGLPGVLDEYRRKTDSILGKDAIDTSHVAALHKLGYLPLEIKALPEGSLVPMGVPMLTIQNTHPDFFWLTNYMETALSCVLWKPCTSATTAYHYRKLFDSYAESTGGQTWFTDFQGHDFSLRGMSGIEDGALSGMGHLLFFKGTDNVPAIEAIRRYYGGAMEHSGFSVPATEHSVMCMGGHEEEIDTFRRLLTKIYPAGIVSVVADTWDFFKVLTEILPTLKAEIMARDGKLVIRPDSGDPVHIVVGNPEAPEGSPERKGAVECLWDAFGGTTNDKGYRTLDSHIGLIYGDSITYARAKAILSGLKDKGFASDNCVFGIGSFTYEYVTRDSLGFAVKSTYGEIDGRPKEIFKNPKTDVGTKKSAKGLLYVGKNDSGDFVLKDGVSRETERLGYLETVFLDGKIVRDARLAQFE